MSKSSSKLAHLNINSNFCCVVPLDKIKTVNIISITSTYSTYSFSGTSLPGPSLSSWLLSVLPLFSLYSSFECSILWIKCGSTSWMSLRSILLFSNQESSAMSGSLFPAFCHDSNRVSNSCLSMMKSGDSPLIKVVHSSCTAFQSTS